MLINYIKIILFISCFICFIISLCWLCYINELYICLYIITSITIFTLLILNLLSAHKILNDYCIRKNLNSNHVIFLNRHWLLSISIISFIVITSYILCINWRLFIFVHNICNTLLVRSLLSKYLTLSHAVIIAILLVSVIISWINVFNNRASNGKFNIWFLIFTLFGSFF